MRKPVTLSIAGATELWIQWAWIALEHRDDARAARERDGGPPAGNPELQASMIAIVAAASAVDGFATRVEEAGIAPHPSEDGRGPGRAVEVWEKLRDNFTVDAHTQTWPRALKELWKLRSDGGGLAHPRTLAGEPTPFPPYVQPPARMTYTADSAARSTALMVEIFVACSPSAVRPGLDVLRQRVEDFTNAGYVDEFARRA
jgi:hypothetical protein